MVELGQLEAYRSDFDMRGVRVLGFSQDDLPASKTTQEAFPHLQIISDADHKMADALAVNDPGRGPSGHDTNVPTTILVDGTGTVRWVGRPKRFRFKPEELLNEVDQHLAGKGL